MLWHSQAVELGGEQVSCACLVVQANMHAVLATAYEIASAMHYLHEHDIVHGDLTGEPNALAALGMFPRRSGHQAVSCVRL